MLKGYDISHWQNVIPDEDYDFLICKATEGKSYKDKSFKKHLENARKRGINLLGAYHFAKTNNDPEDDARNFYNAIKDVPELRKSLLLALDLEGIDIKRKNAYEWARKWLDLVYAETGIRPLIYVSGSFTKYLKPILDGNYGLWVAHYKVSVPRTGVYKTYALWQYTSQPYDKDYFNGSISQYLAYCKSDKGGLK